MEGALAAEGEEPGGVGGLVASLARGARRRRVWRGLVSRRSGAATSSRSVAEVQASSGSEQSYLSLLSFSSSAA